MIIKHNIPIYQICWLNYAKGGTIGTFYEPENLEELIDLARTLFLKKTTFDVIGHTSNIYFLPNYNADIIVSTRRLRNVIYGENTVTAECGTSVKTLARQMVEVGTIGFEGLIDLPGTVAASVYGNASCYNCSINKLLVSFDVLRPEGDVVTLFPADLQLSKRSSSFKRGEQKGIILTVTLNCKKGNSEEIKLKAQQNHHMRISKQPPSQNNLGSIYGDVEKWSILGTLLNGIVGLYGLIYRLKCKDKVELNKRKRALLLKLIGAEDIEPYLYNWNRYIWKDADAHRLFWKYHRKHQLLFKKSAFEIEIKGKNEDWNTNFSPLP